MDDHKIEQAPKNRKNEHLETQHVEKHQRTTIQETMSYFFLGCYNANWKYYSAQHVARWMYGWMDGWVGGWVGGWMDR